MANVYLEYSDLEISKSDVFENKDVEELIEWLEEQRGVSQEIAITLGALKLAPNVDATRMARKLGAINVSIAWIEKRLSQLGVEDDNLLQPKERSLRRHIATMEAALIKYKASLKAKNAEVEALKAQIKAMKPNV